MRLIDADALIERVMGNGLKSITEQIFRKLINDAPTIDAESVWIPCSDRLPSEDGRYLVSYWLMKDMPWISVMYYGKPTFPETDHPCFYVSDDEYGDVEYNDIVAWMPLPKPYEEREGE